MNHLTIAPGEEWSARFIAEVSEFMMVEGTATGAVRWGIRDSEKRELLSGHAQLGHTQPPYHFGGGTPLRPTLPFYVTFKNTGEEPVSLTYRVYSWDAGRRHGAQVIGCAPGCLLVGFALAVPIAGWLL